MAEENVEVVRRVVDLFNTGDFRRIDELADPSWEWHSADELPETAVHHGRDAVKAFIQEFDQQWEEYRLDVERLIESHDQVLLLTRVRARGKSGGVPIERFIGYLNTLRDGRLIRTDVFLDRRAALEAIGQEA